jgi:hypothetical protein
MHKKSLISAETLMWHEKYILRGISSLSVITRLALDIDIGKREAKHTFSHRRHWPERTCMR